MDLHNFALIWLIKRLVKRNISLEFYKPLDPNSNNSKKYILLQRWKIERLKKKEENPLFCIRISKFSSSLDQAWHILFPNILIEKKSKSEETFISASMTIFIKCHLPKNLFQPSELLYYQQIGVKNWNNNYRMVLYSNLDYPIIWYSKTRGPIVKVHYFPILSYI